ELAKEKRLAGYTEVPFEEIEDLTIERGGQAKNARSFDIIGDVHGCYQELADLFEAMGYAWNPQGLPVHPEGRLPVFVGDLTDRGPDSPGVLRLAIGLVAADLGLFVPGNHDDKLFRLLKGNKVTRNNGLDLTEQQLNDLPEG